MYYANSSCRGTAALKHMLILFLVYLAALRYEGGVGFEVWFLKKVSGPGNVAAERVADLISTSFCAF